MGTKKPHNGQCWVSSICFLEAMYQNYIIIFQIGERFGSNCRKQEIKLNCIVFSRKMIKAINFRNYICLVPTFLNVPENTDRKLIKDDSS